MVKLLNFLFNSNSSLFSRIVNKLKKQREKLNKKLRQHKTMLNKDFFVKNLALAGIEKGDTVLVHSSLSKIGNVQAGPVTIIDALIEQVGMQGNVIMPSYSYVNSMLNTTVVEDYVFDAETTPSVVGIITETFRKMANVKRSIHPTHSVCAFGKDATEIIKDHLEAETNFGPTTPFHKIRQLKGKIVGLGISIGPVTIYHTVEDFFPSDFKGVYLPDSYFLNVKIDNQILRKKISIHDPEFHKIRIDKSKEIENWFRQHLKKKGILHESKFGSGNMWWMNIQELFDELVSLKKQGISIYEIL